MSKVYISNGFCMNLPSEDCIIEIHRVSKLDVKAALMLNKDWISYIHTSELAAVLEKDLGCHVPVNWPSSRMVSGDILYIGDYTSFTSGGYAVQWWEVQYRSLES